MFENFITPGIPDAVFWVFVGLGIVIQGIDKSGFGGGVGVLTIPLMLLVMPVEKVVAVLLPLLILLDINAILHHRRNKVWDKVFAIFLPSIPGILIGSLVWWFIGREGIDYYSVALKRGIGLLAIFFAAYILARERALHWAEKVRFGRKSAWVMGSMAGFTSTIAHAAGPIVSLYMFSQGMGKTLFVGTVAWTFTLINLAKVPTYVGLGLIRTDVLWFDATLVWLIPLGSFLGKWMHDRIPETPFYRVIMSFVFLSGIQLVTNFNLVLWALQRLVRPIFG